MTRSTNKVQAATTHPFLVTLVATVFVAATSPSVFRERPVLLISVLIVQLIPLLFATKLRLKVPVSLVFFSVWASLSYFWSSDPLNSVYEIFTLIIIVLMGASFAQLDMSVVAKGFYLGAFSATAISLFTGLVFPTFGRSTEFAGAIVGIYPHRNFLGAVVIMGISISCAFWFNARTPKGKVLHAFAILVFALTGLLTMSGSAAFFSIAVFIFGLSLIFLRRLNGSVRMALAPISITAIFLLSVTALNSSVAWLASLFGRDGTLTGRVDIWAIILQEAMARPLTGYGWGGVWRGEMGAAIRLAFGWDSARSAHNALLDLLIQVGLIGVILLSTTTIVAVFRSIRLAFVNDQYLWLSLLLFAVVINSITESQATRPIGLLIIATVGGLAIKAQSEIRESKMTRLKHLQ